MPDDSRLMVSLRRRRGRGIASWAGRHRPAVAGISAGFIVLIAVALGFRDRPVSPRPASNGSTADVPLVPRAASDGAAVDATTVTPQPIDFETSIVSAIHDRGYFTVTVHVALYQDRRRKARPIADGSHPDSNMYWGALYGVNTHLTKAWGWRRVHQDEGDGAGPIQRAVFQKTIEPTAAWRERTIDAPFDLFLLAEAWPNSKIVDAMNRPIREALCGDLTRIDIDNRPLEFGAGSRIVGYLGQNAMLNHYWDAFEACANCQTPPFQSGVFFIAPRSAVLLHRPAIEHGLYPVLFARESLTPEAYLLGGMLNSLVLGDLKDGFVSEAAGAYVKHQPTVRPAQAEFILMR